MYYTLGLSDLIGGSIKKTFLHFGLPAILLVCWFHLAEYKKVVGFLIRMNNCSDRECLVWVI